jgi:hypothetical protein
MPAVRNPHGGHQARRSLDTFPLFDPTNLFSKDLPMNLHSNRTIRRRFQPRVENLEARQLLSCAVMQNGVNLSIIGAPGQAHTMNLLDDGHGDIQVQCDNQPALTFNGVHTIVVLGANKGNRVSYRMTGVLTETESMTVRLGSGDDTFNAVLEKDFHGITPVAPIDGHLNVFVGTGKGNDQVSLQMLGNLQQGSSLGFNAIGPGKAALTDKETMTAQMQGAVAAGANLSVMMLAPGWGGATENVALTGMTTIAGNVNIDLEGGAGNDLQIINVLDNIAAGGVVNLLEHGGLGAERQLIRYLGQDKGALHTKALGGQGKNLINGQIDLTAGSTGLVNALEKGGPSDDKLRLAIHAPIPVMALIDGVGPGNECWHTFNVPFVNCAVSHLIP